MKSHRLPAIILAACLPFCAISAAYGAIGYDDGSGIRSDVVDFGNINVAYAINSYYSAVPYLSIKSVLTSTSRSYSVDGVSVVATLGFDKGGLNSLRSFASLNQFEKIEFELNGYFDQFLICSTVYLTSGEQNDKCGSPDRSFESGRIRASYYIADHFPGADYDRNSLQYVVGAAGNNAVEAVEFECVFDFSIPAGTDISSLSFSSFVVRLV